MSTTWCSYRARWQGTEYACTPDQYAEGLWVHLQSGRPLDGFDELEPGIYLRLVSAVECDMLAHVTTVGLCRGEPCLVQDERGDELLVEYTGGQVPRALAMGLERIERGVYRGWVHRDEVRGLRENMTLLAPPKN